MMNIRSLSFWLIPLSTLVLGSAIGIYISKWELLSSEWFLALGIPAIIVSFTYSTNLIFTFFVKYKRDKEEEKLKLYSNALDNYFPGSSKNNMMTKSIIALMIQGEDEIAKKTIDFIFKSNGNKKKVENDNGLYELLYEMRKKFNPRTKLSVDDIKI